MTSISQTSASASALPSASASAFTSNASTLSSDDEDNTAVVGSMKSFKDVILEPYMGLLPVEQPNDPWTQKAYNPHYPLYSGGGSYEAYLRPRRDTHIMARSTQMLTPGMLERLLRIKAEFQRRFPHLYQGMLNHHMNQTRVEVTPPLLVRLNNKSKNLSEEAPVYELGAAERGLFDEDEAEAEAKASHEATTEMNESSPFDSRERDTKKDDRDDDDVDYFRFEDDDDNNYNNKNTDADIIDD